MRGVKEKPQVKYKYFLIAVTVLDYFVTFHGWRYVLESVSDAAWERSPVMSERRRYTTFYVTSGLTDGWSKPCYVFHTESVCMIRQGVYNTFPRLPYKIMQFSGFLSLEKLYRLCEELLLTDSYSCGPSCEFGTCAEFHHCMCLSWFCSLWLLLSPFFFYSPRRSSRTCVRMSASGASWD